MAQKRSVSYPVQTIDEETLGENVGIFVRKLIGQNKKISFVQKRNIARQIELYIRTKINPLDRTVCNVQSSRLNDVINKIDTIMDRLESFISHCSGRLCVVLERNVLNETDRKDKDIVEQLDQLSCTTERAIYTCSEVINKLIKELDLCADVLGCSTYQNSVAQEEDLCRLIIKLQTENEAKIQELTEERDLLKVFVQEHQINLENMEKENREMSAQLEENLAEINRLHKHVNHMTLLEREITDISSLLKESEQKRHLLKSQVDHSTKPNRMKSESVKATKNYTNITSLYCNKTITPQSSNYGRKLPDLGTHYR